MELRMTSNDDDFRNDRVRVEIVATNQEIVEAPDSFILNAFRGQAEKWRQHSVKLNEVVWRLGVAVGAIDFEQDDHEGDMDDIVDEAVRIIGQWAQSR